MGFLRSSPDEARRLPNQLGNSLHNAPDGIRPGGVSTRLDSKPCLVLVMSGCGSLKINQISLYREHGLYILARALPPTCQRTKTPQRNNAGKIRPKAAASYRPTAFRGRSRCTARAARLGESCRADELAAGDLPAASQSGRCVTLRQSEYNIERSIRRSQPLAEANPRNIKVALWRR